MFRKVLAGLVLLSAATAVALMAEPSPKSAPQAAPAPAAIAVSTVPARVRDVPVLLSGIGAVEAFQTVQIRSRVDGTLDKVNFAEGQLVKKGDVLAIIDPRLYRAALDSAKAKLAQDKAQLASDEKDLGRSVQLSTQRFASQQTVDQLTAKVGIGRALVQADEAAIRTAETNLSYTTITATFDGRIGISAVHVGNIVRASDQTFIAELRQVDPISVVFTLPEAKLPLIREAQKAGPVSVIALDNDAKRPVAKGKLTVIDNKVDQTTGTIRLKATFDNRNEVLWPGQYASVLVEAGIIKNAVTVPTAAVQRGPNGLYVWVATPQGRAQMAAVEIGPSHEDETVIAKGVTEGDVVIVSNHYRLRPDIQIEPKAKPMAANDAAGRT
ncbi:efflux transporter, RND family, MFP subunit [Rhodomicrobium vannielii ATCC 17100]|uniref:Efflux transporter, RND family, MFP subunit n=1 Tax=Rhodomicrobium vannielii (strain ATCC 17100 / DSM 162 / LMG 4299 / NCIMB 10020 / ATH 3.1.1) TaxID=648757 RepID=E3I527_RHOVT|nr:efflux RND transporter periplasmic adaptor subunit [Rhodomicrobium vannielii]ADP69381.1 efflux transporter, RND family, MFP subunit [Rhodomicrobium vannielii ATCC 17100]